MVSDPGLCNRTEELRHGDGENVSRALGRPNSPYDLIFPNLDGQPMSHSNLMQRGFFPALPAGIKRIRFHDLRHTFASMTISNGEDIVRVSRLMRHATASCTLNVCSHMLPRKHDPSGDRLASLVFGNKMETLANLPTQLELPTVENLVISALLSGGQGRNRTTGTRIFDHFLAIPRLINQSLAALAILHSRLTKGTFLAHPV